MSEIVKTRLSVTATTVATATKSDMIGKKYIIIETPKDNFSIVYVALAYDAQVKSAGKPSSDLTAFEPFAPNEAKKYTAPINKKIYYIFYYTATATQKISYSASDGDLGRSLVHDVTQVAKLKDIREGFTFIERWETLKFNPERYIGRMGAYYKSEALKPRNEWTLPPLIVGGNALEPAPWDNAIDLRNTLDGVTVDEVYMAIPQAFKKVKMRFNAKLPNAAAGYDIWIGFEVVAGAGHALAALRVGTTDITLSIAMLEKDGTEVTASTVVVLPTTNMHPYMLVWDGKTLSLSQYTSPNWVAIGSLSLAGAPLHGDYLVPFFANESTVVTPALAFTLGNIQVHRFDEENARTPVTYNVTMTNLDQEYSQALPVGTKKFLIHTRDESEFRLAFVTGKVATPTAPYFTILAGSVYYEDHIEPQTLTLYFASDSAGKIIEIIAWS